MTQLRYVILEHHWQGVHWDLMIEAAPEGALRTWAIDRLPVPAFDLPARRLPDHRRIYLHREGEVSGGRGTVSRWDQGSCSIVSETENELQLEFTGTHLTGAASLRTISAGDVDSGAIDWVFRFGN